MHNENYKQVSHGFTQVQITYTTNNVTKKDK